MTTPTPTALDPSQVQVGVNNGPGIWVAPAGTLAPATIDTPFDTPWMSLGYLDAAGPTVGSSTTTTELTPWQSVVPIRTLVTARGVTIQAVMWQINPLTLSVYFDTDPTTWDNTSDTIDLDVRSDTPQHVYAVAIDSKDAERIFRLSFTRASLSATGNMTISRGAAIPLDVTLSALDNNGSLARLQVGSSTVTGASASAARGGKREHAAAAA